MSEKPFGVELAFTTSEVEKVMKNAIASGAVLLEETVTKPWGQKVGYLRDLNGFIIAISVMCANRKPRLKHGIRILGLWANNRICKTQGR